MGWKRKRPRALPSYGGAVRRIWLGLVLACAAFFVLGNKVGAADVWLSPTDPFWRASQHWRSSDYFGLFRSEWGPSSRIVNVFEISERLVLQADDVELSSIVAALKRLNIKLSVQINPLAYLGQCGIGVEGYGAAMDLKIMADRLRQHDAELAYVSMDEPLWYGYRWAGDAKPATPCFGTVSAMAANAQTQLASLRRVYPHVVIGDIEPVGLPPYAGETWHGDVSEWLEAYKAAIGEPLGFVTADVVWQRGNWRTMLSDLSDQMFNEHISLGIIYNGDASSRNGEQWIASAVSHYADVEGRLQIVPSRAIFQSWDEFPVELLPDDRLGSFTHLILTYDRWRQETGFATHPHVDGASQ